MSKKAAWQERKGDSFAWMRPRVSARRRLLLAWLVLCCLMAFAGLAQTQVGAPADAGQKTRPGILLLAHGGRLLSWNEEVRHIADKVDLSIPTEIAFGMATKRTIQEGINRLNERGVTEIIAVPLFVSSHSTVITSTEYLLGLRAEAPEDLKMFASMDHGHGGHQESHDSSASKANMTPVKTSVPIRMTPALNHHPIVAKILLDRAASISKDPAHETVVLVAHGPTADEENKRWLEDMRILADEMKQSSQYAEIRYLTVRDDASKEIRNAATQELRQHVEEIHGKNQVALVVPLLLSYGGIEEGIRKRLSGLDYKMASQGLLPDNRIVDWVIDVTKNTTTAH